MRNSTELNKQIAEGLILLAHDYFDDMVFNKVQHPAFEQEALLRLELSKTVFDKDNINYVSTKNKNIARALRLMAYEFDDNIDVDDSDTTAYQLAELAAEKYMNFNHIPIESNDFEPIPEIEGLGEHLDMCQSFLDQMKDNEIIIDKREDK